MKFEMLDGASRRLDIAIKLLDEARRSCRKRSVECTMLEDIVWSLLDARIRLAILRNRVRGGRASRARIARARE
ncbi:MAG: hypothetical protein GXO32_01295 [Crenarchaeota archaeon]|nr:hypothetical protein [Thermoproteota archaeon]